MLKKQKTKLLVLATFLLVAVAVAQGVKTNASSSENVTGWLWGGSDDGTIPTGLGLISMNSTNQGGTTPYGVNVPYSDGNLSGVADAANMGYIAFDNSNGLLNGCPDGNCRAYREGNDIKGWARFTDIAQAGSNAGGNDGWIHLSNQPAYGVTIDPATGKLSGSAWSEFGMIKFRGIAADGTEYGAQIPPVPSMNPLVANPFTINLDAGLLPQNVTISWSNITNATSCVKSGGNWSGTITNPSANGSDTVSQTVASVMYILTCTGPGGTVSESVTVVTGCHKKSCNSGTCELGGSLISPAGTDLSVCTAASTCVSNTDCSAREAAGWKEVAP